MGREVAVRAGLCSWIHAVSMLDSRRSFCRLLSVGLHAIQTGGITKTFASYWESEHLDSCNGVTNRVPLRWLRLA